MASAVSWVLEVAVKPGKLEEFRSLMNEMVASTEKEPGSLSYEWFISEDGATTHIYERYADSAATLVHVGNFGANFAGRFLAAVDPTRLSVYGEPSKEVADALSAFGPAYFGTFGGFAR